MWSGDELQDFLKNVRRCLGAVRARPRLLQPGQRLRFEKDATESRLLVLDEGYASIKARLQNEFGFVPGEELRLTYVDELNGVKFSIKSNANLRYVFQYLALPSGVIRVSSNPSSSAQFRSLQAVQRAA